MGDDSVLLPGARRVVGTLDTPDTDAAACVVAAPPHPQAGGHRGDRRLTAVSDYLVDHDVACLRFDYGDWDGGYGEREDTRNALRWAADGYDHVGLFGYSFGASMSLLAAATTDVDLDAVCALAPHAAVDDTLDVTAAIPDIHVPLRIVVGIRDRTVDWEPVVAAARDHGDDVVELQADHHFVGQNETVASACGEFLLATR